MYINKDLLKEFEDSNSRILVVTKYFDKEDTLELIEELDKFPLLVEWYWENRLEGLEWKEIDRERIHFIWNLQTKQIKKILQYTDTIHSVDNIKQVKKIEDICSKMWIWAKIFIQVNVDETKEWWIEPEQIPDFLEQISEFENVSLIGFSCIWRAEFTEEEKEREFDLMLSLREKYIPNWLISAGTSVDYKIALKKGIDIIRIGRKLFE